MASKRAPSTRENVKVVARIRPTNQKEISSGGISCVKFTDKTIEVSADNDGSNNFSFDQIFGPESTQIDVFEYTAVPLINDVLAGYNATIFAYGQTGTGKTHTMEGSIHNAADKGIIPRSVEALFNGVLEADENIEFTFKVSYVEIYMEKIRDLLDDNRLKTNLNVREDKIKGIYIAGVTEVYVTSHLELLGIMATGSANRATAATGMNEGSSRSHSVFTITVNQRNLGNNTTTTGKLVLVDLAGSEMVRKSNASGQQLEEAKTINKSLSALGQVINALTVKDHTHVPYRDSKLTRILQDSLGGNAKTVLIVAVSPSSYNASETISTLRFGTRAKSIENKVTVNQTRSVEELENLLIRAEKAIDIQATHIATLTAQVEALSVASGGGGGIGVNINNTGSSNDNNTVNNNNDSNSNDINNSNNSNTTNNSEGYIDLQQQLALALAAVKVSEVSRIELEKINITLQESMNSLIVEIEEEKLESLRKDNELYSLTGLLREKEQLLGEAGELLIEAQKQYLQQKESNDLLTREKNELIVDFDSIKSHYKNDLDKLIFDKREYEVMIETLRTETMQLKKDIDEMTGDIDTSNNNNNSSSNKVKSRPIDSNMMTSSAHHSSDNLNKTRTSLLSNNNNNNNTDNQENNNNSNTNNILNKNNNTTSSTTAAKEEIDNAFYTELTSLCTVKYDCDESIFTEIQDLIKLYLTSRLSHTVNEYEIRTNKDKQSMYDANRKIQDLQNQRVRLENDLSEEIKKYTKLSFDMDVLKGMDGVCTTDYFTNRERANSRSLQQRLEQLVVVHRQLLRKFASMELENGEYRKKIVLRDERIKQLENSGRGLVGSMRQQAERHVGELTYLREQLQLARMEYNLRLENIQANITGLGNVIGGGGGSAMMPSSKYGNNTEIRTMRGGHPSTATSATGVTDGSGGCGMSALDISSKVIRGKQHNKLPPGSPTSTKPSSAFSTHTSFSNSTANATATKATINGGSDSSSSSSGFENANTTSGSAKSNNGADESSSSSSTTKVSRGGIFSRLLGQT